MGHSVFRKFIKKDSFCNVTAIIFFFKYALNILLFLINSNIEKAMQLILILKVSNIFALCFSYFKKGKHSDLIQKENFAVYGAMTIRMKSAKKSCILETE